MALNLFNYDKAGAGVAKQGEEKRGVKLFFEIYLRKFWKLITLNLLTFLFCIPIVTIGPALAGMTRVLRNYSIEKNAYIFSDFWKGFKDNWKQALVISLFDALFIVSFVAAIIVYPNLAKNSENGIFYYVMGIISVSVFVTVAIMNFYIFTMMVSTNLKFIQVIKNSYSLTFAALFKNLKVMLLVAVIIALVCLGCYYSYLTYLLIPFWLISFLGFIIVYNSYPVVEKYVINPFYEEKGQQNPDYDYLKPVSDSDTVFTDNGGNDVPINPGSKNKTIS